MWVFVVCDVVATIVQVAGAALIGVSESNRRNPDTANDILLAGLVFQVFSFALFLILYVTFIKKTWHVLSVPALQEKKSTRVKGDLRVFVVVMLGSAGLVYLRTIFRLAETAQGVMGFAMSHEVFFGVLEFAPVVVAVGGMGFWHPGQFVGRKKGVIGDEVGGMGNVDGVDEGGIVEGKREKKFGMF